MTQEKIMWWRVALVVGIVVAVVATLGAFVLLRRELG